MHPPPPDRHIECLAEDDWVDIDVPPRELNLKNPHDDTTPSPSGRKYGGFDVSTNTHPDTLTPTTPDAWLALAEESMRASRVGVSARTKGHAAHLTRACANALGTTDTRCNSTEFPAFKPKTPFLSPTRVVVARPHTRSFARRVGSIGNAVGGVAAVAVAFLVSTTTIGLAPCASTPVYSSRWGINSSETATSAFCPISAGEIEIDTAHASQMNETINSLRAALAEANASVESMEAEVALLSRNTLAATANAVTWRRAGEAWYDAYADVVDAKATKNKTKKTRDLKKTKRVFAPT
jgi:hypothetical protein